MTYKKKFRAKCEKKNFYTEFMIGIDKKEKPLDKGLRQQLSFRESVEVYFG